MLLGGDAGVAGTVHESAETLIAIGTQTGKVMVFNVLGLLIHEIVMGMPVINVEWVGDMSAPSILPNRVSSLSPEPRSVIDMLWEEAEAEAAADEESGTVKRTVSPLKRAGVQEAIPTAYTRDLFSDDLPQRVSRLPARGPSDVSNGSPLQIERTRERPRRKSLIRPRIATETFKSPATPSSRPTASASAAGLSPYSIPPIQEVRRWPQIHHAPEVPLASRARKYPSSEASSPSSLDSELSDEDFFTAPSTRQDKGKTPQRLMSPRASIGVDKSPARNLPPLRNRFPQRSNTPSGLSSRPTSRTIDHVVAIRDDGDAGPSNWLSPQPHHRQVTIDAPDWSLSPDLSTNSSSRPTTRTVSSPFLKDQGAVGLGGRSSKIPQRRVTRNAGNMLPLLDTSSNPYSRRTSGMFRSPPRAVDGEMDTPSSVAASVDRSPFARRPRREFSFEAGLHKLEASAEQRFKVARRGQVTTGVNKMRQLRDDSEALRKEMLALRAEFRALKDILLSWTPKA